MIMIKFGADNYHSNECGHAPCRITLANDAPLTLFTDACTRPLAIKRSCGNGSPSTASTALCITCGGGALTPRQLHRN